MFTELLKYRQQTGHTHVPTSEKECRELGVDRDLSQWTQAQRKLIRQRKLSSIQRVQLEGLGFLPNAQEAAWFRRYHELLAVGLSNVDRHKHPLLYRWITKQRTLYRIESLDKERIEYLEEAGFVFNQYDHQWNETYTKLKQYRKDEGLTFEDIIEEDPFMDAWLDRQRFAYRAWKENPNEPPPSPLTKERIKLLDELGIVWVFFETLWEDHFQALKDHHETNGDWIVKENDSLRRWISWQRYLKSSDKLPIDRQSKLDSIGFPWSGLRD